MLPRKKILSQLKKSRNFFLTSVSVVVVDVQNKDKFTMVYGRCHKSKMLSFVWCELKLQKYLQLLSIVLGLLVQLANTFQVKVMENIINLCLCLLLTQSETPVGFVHLFEFVTLPTRRKKRKREISFSATSLSEGWEKTTLQLRSEKRIRTARVSLKIILYLSFISSPFFSFIFLHP